MAIILKHIQIFYSKLKASLHVSIHGLGNKGLLLVKSGSHGQISLLCFLSIRHYSHVTMSCLPKKPVEYHITCLKQ